MALRAAALVALGPLRVLDEGTAGVGSGALSSGCGPSAETFMPWLSLPALAGVGFGVFEGLALAGEVARDRFGFGEATGETAAELGDVALAGVFGESFEEAVDDGEIPFDVAGFFEEVDAVEGVVVDRLEDFGAFGEDSEDGVEEVGMGSSVSALYAWMPAGVICATTGASAFGS